MKLTNEARNLATGSKHISSQPLDWSSLKLMLRTRYEEDIFDPSGYPNNS